MTDPRQPEAEVGSVAVPAIPVGPATKAGYSTAAIAFVLAIVAYLTGDHSQQTVGTLAAGGIGLVSFAGTQAGRYLQAHAATKVHGVAVGALAGGFVQAVADELPESAARPDPPDLSPDEEDALIAAEAERLDGETAESDTGQGPARPPGPPDPPLHPDHRPIG